MKEKIRYEELDDEFIIECFNNYNFLKYELKARKQDKYQVAQINGYHNIVEL